MEIREAALGDAAGLAEVHVAVWRSVYAGLMPDELLDDITVERRKRMWDRVLAGEVEQLPDNRAWVAEDDGGIIGFSWVGENRDGDVDHAGELYAIYVLEEHWDTGLGARLMEPAMALLAEEFDEATLWVLDTNERGRSFYERGGWSTDGATKEEEMGDHTLTEVRYRLPLDQH